MKQKSFINFVRIIKDMCVTLTNKVPREKQKFNYFDKKIISTEMHCGCLKMQYCNVSS